MDVVRGGSGDITGGRVNWMSRETVGCVQGVSEKARVGSDGGGRDEEE